MDKKLTRSCSNKVLGGVCGGLSEYFNMDVTLIRVIFVAIALFGGASVLVYLLCWILIPKY